MSRADSRAANIIRGVTPRSGVSLRDQGCHSEIRGVTPRSGVSLRDQGCHSKVRGVTTICLCPIENYFALSKDDCNGEVTLLVRGIARRGSIVLHDTGSKDKLSCIQTLIIKQSNDTSLET